MTYKKIGQTYFGFQKARIEYVFQDIPEFFQGFSLLITCLDSSPNPNALMDGPTLKPFTTSNIIFPGIGGGIFVPPKNIQSVFEGGIFNGFDEVYLLRGDTQSEVKGQFTSDRANFIADVPPGFLLNFQNVGAVRYLSDGLGLNFACESVELAEKIMKMSEA